MSNSVTLCKEKFIEDIGRDTFLNSFRSFEYDFDTVCVSNMKEAGEYNIQLLNGNRLVESKRIRKNSDAGEKIRIKYFD